MHTTIEHQNHSQREFFFHTYLCERLRIAFTAVPKSGCTSFLWMLSDAEANPRRTSTSFTPEFTRDQCIHDPAFSGLARLDQLTSSQVATVCKSDLWTRLTLIRSPYDRLASAWIDRALLKQSISGYEIERTSAGIDLRDEFRRFVHLLEHAGHLLEDAHLMPQAWLLDFPGWKFEHLIRLESIDQYVSELTEAGVLASGCKVPRLNESLPIKAADLFDAELEEVVYRLYKDDFEQLGFDRRDFATPQSIHITRFEAALLHHLRMRNDRVQDLAATCQRLSADLRVATGARAALRVILRRIVTEAQRFFPRRKAGR